MSGQLAWRVWTPSARLMVVRYGAGTPLVYISNSTIPVCRMAMSHTKRTVPAVIFRVCFPRLAAARYKRTIPRSVIMRKQVLLFPVVPDPVEHKAKDLVFVQVMEHFFDVVPLGFAGFDDDEDAVEVIHEENGEF